MLLQQPRHGTERRLPGKGRGSHAGEVLRGQRLAAAAAYGHDDMTMVRRPRPLRTPSRRRRYPAQATEAQTAYTHGGGGDDMTMATHDAGFDQMVEDEISKRSGAGFA